MIVARLAYLTTPAPGVIVLNVQPEGCDGIIRYEISQAHLARILVAGTALAFNDQLSRVPASQTNEGANERTDHRA